MSSIEIKNLHVAIGEKEIVQGLSVSPFSQEKINLTVNELKAEKAMATELGLVK